MHDWTILTCEYPPDCGGVGDYTAQVASALAAAGDRVTVFTPPAENDPSVQAGVDVVVLPDCYGAEARRELTKWLDGRESRVLVQYVANAFGSRGANIPWCRWLQARARRHGNDVRVLFHEPYLYFEGIRPDRNALAVAQRLMAAILLRSARRSYISTDAWRPYLEPYAPARRPPLVAIPIPSAVPRCDSPVEVGARRRALMGSAGALVGHFGTYGSHIAPMLRGALERLLTSSSDVVAVCVGSGSNEFVRGLVSAVPSIEGRLHSTGRIPATQVSVNLQACDLLLQPYPDGVTTRRTSVMAGLVNRRAVLTTTGRLTESVWADTGAVALAPATDMQAFERAVLTLLSDRAARAELANRGERTYESHFALARSMATLRSDVEGAAA
jgi:hypothetical protein